MTNIILLVLCLVLGVLLQRNKSLPKDAHLTLNTIILFVPLPAIALLNVPLLKFDVKLLGLAVGPWLIFLMSYLLIPIVGKYLKFDRATIGCLILTTGLGNTAFVGFPLLEALYGVEVIKYAVFLDQLGTFLIVSVVGIGVAAKYSAGKLRLREMALKVLCFPPFVSFFVSLALGLAGWHAQGMTKDILSQLSLTLTPLALISVGLQLRVKNVSADLKPLAVGLGFKLFLAPIMIFIVFKLMNTSRVIFEVSVIEAAMAPMITGAIVAANYSLNPRLSGLMVGLGVPLSFVTVYLWYLFVSVG
jgi:predicted permease